MQKALRIFTSYCSIQRLMILELLFCLGITVRAEVIGDSVASIVNNWKAGDYALYRNYSGRIRIEGRDTITEREEPETITKVLLSEVLPNEDKVFIITTQTADSAKMTMDMGDQTLPKEAANTDAPVGNKPFTEKDKDELYAQFLKLIEIPVTILTDFSGEVKDIYNYESLRSEMDSCFNQVMKRIESIGMAEDLYQTLTQNMQNMWDRSVSKEALMARCDLFRYYGYNYPLGVTSDQAKLPLISDDYQVDATVTFSCEPVETESGMQLIEITSVTSYNSDQVMDSLLSSFVGEDAHALRAPDRPYVSMNITEQFLFDQETGTVVAYTTQKKTISSEKTIIEYSASEWE